MRAVLIAMTVFIASPAIAQVSDSHYAAAQELLVLTDTKRQMMGGAEAMADAMLQQNPALRPYRDVLLEWAASVMTWENFEQKFIDLYVDAFTEGEIREMIAFYSTPTGQKSVRLGPDLMKRGAMLGGEVAAENAAELQAMIAERAAELENLSRSGAE